MSVVGRGRPLRFLLILAIAWVGLRTAMLWPAPRVSVGRPTVARAHGGGESRRAVRRAAAPSAAHSSGRAPSPIHRAAPSAPLPMPMPTPPPKLASARTHLSHARYDAAAALPATPGHRDDASLARAAGPLLSAAPMDRDAVARAAMILPSAFPVTPPSTRWSGSAWLVARGGAALSPGALGGQLGGSQAGARLVYALDPGRRIALVGRVTTPLGGGLREASLGIEWQPTRLPVRLVAEQRVALSDGHGGPGIGVIGGFGPIAIGPRLRAESYAQAGLIRRAATEPYVDGAVRVTHPIAHVDTLRFDLGGGVWGGAQRGATRLDIGPTLGAALPLGKQSLRLALDWRQRVVGDAHPGSGPAVTLGSDF